MVATTNWSRRRSSHWPRIASLRPAVSGDGGTGYTSAQSKKVTPPADALSRMANEVFSSHWWPKVIVPRQISETLRPVRPMRRVCIRGYPVWNKYGRAKRSAAANNPAPAKAGARCHRLV